MLKKLNIEEAEMIGGGGYLEIIQKIGTFVVEAATVPANRLGAILMGATFQGDSPQNHSPKPTGQTSTAVSNPVASNGPSGFITNVATAEYHY